MSSSRSYNLLSSHDEDESDVEHAGNDWGDDNEDHDASINSGSSRQRRTLGMLNGVFAPVCLSMFSTLLFLRVGYIVGNAGIIVSVAQLFMAFVILALTVCSVSAIATNGAVEGGGVYFMISRTLGPELGGKIASIHDLVAPYS